MMNLAGLLMALLAIPKNNTNNTNRRQIKISPSPTNKNRNNSNNSNKNKNGRLQQARAASSSSTSSKFTIHDKRLKWAIETNAVFLIDLENVRGKSNFELTHDELLKRTTLWAKVHNLYDDNRITLVVDHGSVHASYYLPNTTTNSNVDADVNAEGNANGDNNSNVDDNSNGEANGKGGGMSIVFAGTRMKADDVLARDVGYFHRNVIVITADNDLMSRCRNAMERAEGNHVVQFINPIKFISDLDVLMNRVQREERKQQQQQQQKQQQQQQLAFEQGKEENGDNSGSTGTDTKLNEELANKIDEEIKLRGSLYETQTQMREKKNMNTPKKRRKLEKRARQLCERLAMKGGQNIDHLTTLDGISAYDRKFQDEVLKQWTELRGRATRREMTGDRILLAEYFRRQVESAAAAATTTTTTTTTTDNNAANSEKDTLIQQKDSFSYSEYINNLAGNNMATSMSSGGLSSASNNASDQQYSGKAGTVRLVVVSDTHGMEESLTPRGTILPPGDILLHLGDFAIDAPLKKKKKAIAKFDQWLARQPHRTKIVLRGNHDPFKVDFPESCANFVSMPKSIAIDGKLTMTLVPYSSPRKLSSSWRKMPMYCDVLASHSPPKNILDKCYNGANAGCAALRGKVEKMIFGAPSLWLCGHIHEGRGREEVAFGLSSRKTLVVNAANANTGRATSIKYGPIVLDVHQNQTSTLLQGDGVIDEEVVGATTKDESLLVPSS